MLKDNMSVSAGDTSERPSSRLKDAMSLKLLEHRVNVADLKADWQKIRSKSSSPERVR